MPSWNIDLPTTLYASRNIHPRLAEETQVIVGTDSFQQLINEVAAEPIIAIDTETTGLVTWKDIPLYWSLAWGRKRATLTADLLPYFQPIFADVKKEWVFANAKYDMHILANVGFRFAGKCADTQVMHALLYEDKPHKLKVMAQHILKWTWADFQDTFGKISEKLGVTAEAVIHRAEAENMELLVEYAANDAWGTLHIYHALKKQLDQALTHSLFVDVYPYIRTLWDLFARVERPYTKALWNMERKGAKIDKARLDKEAPGAAAEIKGIEKEIAGLVGYVLNPNSPKQVQKYLFEERGLSPIKWTKGGKTGTRTPSADKDVLNHYSHDDPVAALILKHHELSKLYGTYLVGLSDVVDPYDRIHSSFNQSVARTGRLSSSNPNCFSGETEVLTTNGWITLKSYLQQPKMLKVAQWDQGTIEFVEPTATIQVNAPKLLRIKLKQIDLAVTPDHRCLLQHRKTGRYKVVKASDYPEDYLQIHAGKYYGKGIKLTHSEIRFLVAIQADGSWSWKKLDVSFKKSRKIKRFQWLLDNLSIDQVDYTKKKDKRGRTRFRVQGDIVAIAKRYLGKEKEFGPWILKLSRSQLDVFCNEVWFWDGCWTIKNHYASKDKNSSDWVQAAFALSGKRARQRLYVNSIGSRSWQVDVTNRCYSTTTNRTITKEASSDGKAYCVTVPSSYLLVRHKGVVMVTGNCQNIPRPENDKWHIRDAFIPEKGYSIIAIDYEQLEMRLLACAAMEAKMIEIFASGKDIHTGNVEMVFDIPYDDVVAAKEVDKRVKKGELDASALNEYVQLCLQRRMEIKSVGFGLNYGMGPGRLAKQLGISQREAQAHIERYKSTYGAVGQFFKDAVAETERTGYAFTVMGRRRNIPEIASTKRDERALGERLACNTQIQGSAADVTRAAQTILDMIDIAGRYDCHQILQVHDEIVFECPTENVEKVLPEIRYVMEHPFSEDLAVHLAVDAGYGSSWEKAK